MRKTFTLLLLVCSYFTHAQTIICGTANENGSVTLTVPPGNSIISIDFASYGTPNGACGSFTIGSCHAANSLSIVEAAFVGQSSATINASNGVFGDPCAGTVKRLYIQATYSSTLPLLLLSFTAQKTATGQVKLDWRSDQEINTAHFVIEQSVDGLVFVPAGTVQAAGSGSHRYSFTTGALSTSSTYYFRLKMVDVDGRFQYSTIARINNNNTTIGLAVFPNPSTGVITISSDKKQDAVIANSIGGVVRNISLVKGTQAVDISSLSTGVYFIRTGEGVIRFIKK